MPTRNVVLTDHQAALLDRLVASGRYQNASEAMRAGLRRIEEEEDALQDLKRRADRALALFSDPDAPRIPLGDALDRAFSRVPDDGT